MIFLTGGLGVSDGDVEYEVDLVMSGAVLDVAVLNDADEADDLGFGAEFLADLAS